MVCKRVLLLAELLLGTLHTMSCVADGTLYLLSLCLHSMQDLAARFVCSFAKPFRTKIGTMPRIVSQLLGKPVASVRRRTHNPRSCRVKITCLLQQGLMNGRNGVCGLLLTERR